MALLMGVSDGWLAGFAPLSRQVYTNANTNGGRRPFPTEAPRPRPFAEPGANTFCNKFAEFRSAAVVRLATQPCLAFLGTQRGIQSRGVSIRSLLDIPQKEEHKRK